MRLSGQLSTLNISLLERWNNSLKIIILTAVEKGHASICLENLINNPKISVLGVIFLKNTAKKSFRFYKKKFFKILRIGIFGTINGVRIRHWFIPEADESIFDLCDHLNIPLFFSENINAQSTKDILSKLEPDLGVSLGNSYIGKKIFSIPKYGMINIHTEILPKYQGAHSVIWPIFYKEEMTGFTIHQIDKSIDTGNILFSEEIPISFRKNLKDTVQFTSLHVAKRLPKALENVCENYLALKEQSVKQRKNKAYTTPTIFQYIKMKINNRIMYNKIK